MVHNIEQRLAEIEEEVRRIRAQLKVDDIKHDWITKTKGCFRGDSHYAEIARLGKEIRDAEESELDE